MWLMNDMCCKVEHILTINNIQDDWLHHIRDNSQFNCTNRKCNPLYKSYWDSLCERVSLVKGTRKQYINDSSASVHWVMLQLIMFLNQFWQCHRVSVDYSFDSSKCFLFQLEQSNECFGFLLNELLCFICYERVVHVFIWAWCLHCNSQGFIEPFTNWDSLRSVAS